MHFVAILTDRDGGLPIRLENRSAHLEWLQTVPVRIAGPLLDDKGDMAGTMLVVEADDLDAAQAVLATDPYAKAGLFQSSSLRPWRWVIGKPA